MEKLNHRTKFLMALDFCEKQTSCEICLFSNISCPLLESATLIDTMLEKIVESGVEG